MIGKSLEMVSSANSEVFSSSEVFSEFVSLNL